MIFLGHLSALEYYVFMKQFIKVLVDILSLYEAIWEIHMVDIVTVSPMKIEICYALIVFLVISSLKTRLYCTLSMTYIENEI